MMGVLEATHAASGCNERLSAMQACGSAAVRLMSQRMLGPPAAQPSSSRSHPKQPDFVTAPLRFTTYGR